MARLVTHGQSSYPQITGLKSILYILHFQKFWQAVFKKFNYSSAVKQCSIMNGPGRLSSVILYQIFFADIQCWKWVLILLFVFFKDPWVGISVVRYSTHQCVIAMKYEKWIDHFKLSHHRIPYVKGNLQSLGFINRFVIFIFVHQDVLIIRFWMLELLKTL